MNGTCCPAGNVPYTPTTVMLEVAPIASMVGVTLVGRAMLSAIFLTASVAKLVDRSGSRRSLIEFGFPSSAVPPLSIGVPIAELMVAAALLPVASVRAGAAAALLLLAAFSITIATALARGRHVECRCFGQLTSGIVSWRTLARNAVLAVVALAVLLADLGSPPPSLFDAVSTLRGAALVAWTVGLAAVAIIGLGAWAFVHLLRAHGRLLLRVEHLEQQLVHAGLADALGDLTGEAEGLPPGSPVPVMTADDIEGGPADWKDLLDRSRSLLLLFTSPQCAPCRELRPEIRAWQQRLGSQLRFGLASDGRVEEIRREAVEFGVTDPLVDRDLRLFHAFEAKGTPSAVLVRSDGTIGSHLAGGRAATRALLAREAAKNDARSAAAPAIAPAPGTALPQLRLRRLDVALARSRTSSVNPRSSCSGTPAAVTAERCTTSSAVGSATSIPVRREWSSCLRGTRTASAQRASRLRCYWTPTSPMAGAWGSAAPRWQSSWMRKAALPLLQPPGPTPFSR